MGKLIGYELKKTLSGRFFLIALCLMLMLDFSVLGGLREYRNLKTSIEDGTMLDGTIAPEDRTYFRFMAVSRGVTDNLRREYSLLSQLSNTEKANFVEKMDKKYGVSIENGEFPEITEELSALPGYFGESQSDLSSILYYQDILSWNAKSQVENDRVVRAATTFAEEALAAGDAYSLRRNQNIIRLYSLPRKEITAPVRGWQEFLFETPVTLLVSLLILLACAGSVSDEHTKGTWTILQSAKNGKGKTLAAKYCTGAIISVVVTVLLQAVSLGAIWFKGGLLGFNQPVVAIQELSSCPYSITVWQYSMIFIGCQIFTAILLSIFEVTISALSRSSILAYGSGGIFLGICLVLYYCEPNAELSAGLLGISQPLKYFSSYVTGNVLGFPVLRLVLHGLFWLAFGGGAIVVVSLFYRRNRR